LLRLIGFLAMLTIGGGGFLTLDYSMARKLAAAGDDGNLTISEYLGGLSERIARVTSSSAPPGLPTRLQDMLPKPPEGWTVRPAVAEDVAGFLPRSGVEADARAVALVQDVVNENVANAAEVAILTYERGERRVIVKAVRYPDVIFTGPMALQQRFDLQTQTAQFLEISAMTVRGLDVIEDALPDGMRGRLFMADVGAQIHLRLLAPRRMPDRDLLPFFETLHVKAMNAAVVDKRDGLGDLPVIVLASALDRDQRNAYDADRAARVAAESERAREERAAAEAQVAAAAALKPEDEATAPKPEPAATVLEATCEQGADGVKRCRVAD
jgi:hypothetical protein